MSHKTLYCLAEGCDGHWEAVCLNFDLAVQGVSYPEVQMKMREAIEGYIEVIRDYPPREQLRFLRRRAPLSLWLKFYWIGFCRQLSKWFDGHNGHHKELADFRIECPASPTA